MSTIDVCQFYEFEEDMTSELIQVYDRLKSKETEPYAPPLEYTRKNQTKELSALLNELVNIKSKSN